MRLRDILQAYPLYDTCISDNDDSISVPNNSFGTFDPALPIQSAFMA